MAMNPLVGCGGFGGVVGWMSLYGVIVDVGVGDGVGCVMKYVGLLAGWGLVLIKMYQK